MGKINVVLSDGIEEKLRDHVRKRGDLSVLVEKALYGFLGDRCVACGAMEDLVDHHVLYEPEVMVKLCRSCHHKVHHEERDNNVTKIQISDEVWRELNSMKRRGESFDGVIRRLIDHWKETR